jgi:hypothetical protein
MKGKYSNWLVHAAASLNRDLLRKRLTGLVEWKPLINPDPGCTAIIGVCSNLPDILVANLRCLLTSRWPELKRVIVVADCVAGTFPIDVEREVLAAFSDLNVEFFYYSSEQLAFANKYKLGYLYAWLSWCIALKHVRTSHVLVHDYDALILGAALQHRYGKFVDSGAKVQGIGWYIGNGITVDDRLATTFEAFMDAAWLRSCEPVSLFNKFRVIQGRSIDFDTTLDAQYLLSVEQRTAVPMSLDELVHPSQMICQYTSYQRTPGAPLPCFSIPMIPFFYYLGGRTDAVEHATHALERGNSADLDLLGDNTRINLSMLKVEHVHWLLKQIVQACCALSIPPDHRIYQYGNALYRAIRVPVEDFWICESTQRQQAWISAAAVSGASLNK